MQKPTTLAPPANKRAMASGNRKIVLLAALVGSLVLTALTVWAGYAWMTLPAGDTNTVTVIDIPPGMSLKKTAQTLEDDKIIRSALSFRLLAYLEKKSNKVRIGEYALSPNMPPAEILRKITSGQTVPHPVTIPEGYRIAEIAEHLSNKGLVRKDKFLEQVRNPEFLKYLAIPADTLEGYLFPDTYHFSKYTDETVVIRTMLESFRKTVLLPEFLRRARELNLSFHQVVTLASLIEKETGRREERPLIASAFHNRLKKKMLLQTDPTVIYALPGFDGNLRKKDLSYDSPYNTYKYPGLPPGPIASPGKESMQAALYPATTDYLYFVSKQDGTHYFSANLQEHNNAVAKYQLHKH
jgi:UPF0755 protein